jgi:Retrotransposon gag protein
MAEPDHAIDNGEHPQDEYGQDEYEMDADAAETADQSKRLATDPAAPPKKKKQGGKKGRESKKRSRKTPAEKLREHREKLRIYRAGIAAATQSPRSHALTLQDMEELRQGEAGAGALDDVTRATLLSLVREAKGKATPTSAESIQPRLDLTKVVNKPSTFDGTGGRFHEWKNEVAIYLSIMNFSPEQEASIVQGYLRGTALAWWIQKLQSMKANGISPPATYDELLHYLNERFEHRNPELAARDRLMGLRQNDKTLHQYLREFEGCYAFIPTWDEADKIHRFMYGLKAQYRSKFSVDPATHKWWTSFDALIAYISAYISDDVSHRADVAEEIAEIVMQAGGPTAERPKPPRKSRKRQNGGGFKRLNQVLKALSGRVQKPPTVHKNANGEIVNRSKGIKTWCHQQRPQRCLGCYESGHKVANCTNAVARGAPASFQAQAQE